MITLNQPLKNLKFCHSQTSLNFLISNLCNGLFENSFLKLLIPLGLQIQSGRIIGQSQISLRNDNDLYAPPANLSVTSNHPLSTLPNIWDGFADENTKFKRNKPEFDKALKTHFLKKLAISVKCNNPFCPSCVLHVS
jgi:hypothetical protein